MAWNPNIPAVTNRVQDDLDAIRENFQVLDAHLADTNNPHQVTAAQVGAPTQAEFDAHVADTNNPHNVQAQQVPYSSGVAGFSPADVKAALDALAGVRIVEMGSNSNGTYVRWENGLQVCFGWVVVFTGDGTSGPKSGTLPLPASFSASATLWAGNEQYNTWRAYQDTNIDPIKTEFIWRAERKSGVWVTGLNYPIHFIAIGRWK